MPGVSAGGESLQAWTRALGRIAPLSRGEGVALPTFIQQLAKRFGPRPALLSDAEVVSYQELAERANRYARWALQQELAAGEVVCLLLANCPDYVAIWLGITSVGGVVALINTNLSGDVLTHAVSTVGPKHIIVGDTYADRVEAVRARLPSTIQRWAHGADGAWPRIDLAAAQLSSDPLQRDEAREPPLTDTALYIYTSGTTGLPKAAKVSHRRVMEWSCWFAGMIDTSPGDRMYNCLPLYHSVGGIVAVGAMLVGGGSVLIRPRFSASRFWDEVVDYDCTVFQYIGELCRYLVNAPPRQRETGHRLRLCCGNGLRADVWETFQRRFHIPRILEFYASTEGNVSLYNCTGRVGAIGHIPAFLAHRFPMVLVRCDLETGEPLRGADGLCIRPAPDEVGEALGKIGGGASDNGRPFEGYTDPGASDAKVLRDVVVRGDAWFRTGDLMRKDSSGFFYFVDRIGDTFRWKGENVATEEVAQALRLCPGVSDAVVYGVHVPRMEGRAGMAAITVGPAFELASLRDGIHARLPDYARPLFVRLCQTIDVTGTFKPMKAALAREGYDPEAVRDALYFDDRDRGAFVVLDAALHERICAGQVRL